MMQRNESSCWSAREARCKQADDGLFTSRMKPSCSPMDEALLWDAGICPQHAGHGISPCPPPLAGPPAAAWCPGPPAPCSPPACWWSAGLPDACTSAQLMPLRSGLLLQWSVYFGDNWHICRTSGQLSWPEQGQCCLLDRWGKVCNGASVQWGRVWWCKVYSVWLAKDAMVQTVWWGKVCNATKCVMGQSAVGQGVQWGKVCDRAKCVMGVRCAAGQVCNGAKCVMGQSVQWAKCAMYLC